MAKLIDREELYNKVYQLACDSAGVIDGICSDYAHGLATAAHMIEEAPAVDVLPVRHAYWIMHPHGAECSECKYTFRIQPTLPTVMPLKPWWRFCPSCGAKMDEKR